ncbi:MAG: YcaO-like family protein [Myxococcota bacterium]
MADPRLRPDDLLARITPLMKRAGITRVANITGLDNVGIPVVMVVRPTSRSLSVSQGKGVTLPGAKISGVMEALEQFHAERIHLPLTLATRHELERTRRVVDVERLPRTTRHFDEHTRILWVTAEDLVSGDDVEVPFEVVHLDLSTPLPEGSGHFVLGSNGLASGTDFPHAVAHGLWEVIERDAVALFYERSAADQAARRIPLASIDDPCCRSLIRRLESAGLAVAVWDLTTEIGVGTLLCAIAEREIDPLHRVGEARGSGCHPERSHALRRAITEAAQSRLTRIAGSRDDMTASEVAAIRSVDAIERHRMHIAQESSAAWQFDRVPSATHASTEEAVAFTLDRLSHAGFHDVLTVDLSLAEEPIAVVRTIVPGLESLPDAASYAPGARVMKLRANRCET